MNRGPASGLGAAAALKAETQGDNGEGDGQLQGCGHARHRGRGVADFLAAVDHGVVVARRNACRLRIRVRRFLAVNYNDETSEMLKPATYCS